MIGLSRRYRRPYSYHRPRLEDDIIPGRPDAMHPYWYDMPRKRLRGGAFDPKKDIRDAFLGPVGWISMGVRKSREKKLEALRKEWDQLVHEGFERPRMGHYENLFYRTAGMDPDVQQMVFDQDADLKTTLKRASGKETEMEKAERERKAAILQQQAAEIREQAPAVVERAKKKLGFLKF